jgi:hypothetical protein
MDYLDPKAQARHRLVLYAGYILIAFAIALATIILVNQAYGYGIGKNGTIIQNSLAFFSSQPNPAKIYTDGKLSSSQTNTRLYLPAGIYGVSLKRNGYYPWKRTIELNGGEVEHFDYPFLFPTTLTTSKLATYPAAPTLMTESTDQHWLLVGKPGSYSGFDLYDLRNPTKAPVGLDLPANLLSKATTSESLKVVSWANDNQHVLLEHDFDGKIEFILVDISNPSQSYNLNNSLDDNPGKLVFINNKYNQYYLYDDSSETLESASLSSTTKTTVLQHVLAYDSYGDSTYLYVTNQSAPANKVLLKMLVGGNTYTLHSLPVSPSYVVDLTEYNGVMYVAAGASNSSKVYIYDNPLGQLAQNPGQAVTPIQVLRVDEPDYLSFSNNAQFIVAENGSHYGVYDIENQKGYNYKTATPTDSPMVHAEWMDGDRLYYISNGKLVVFDYDHTNIHTLVPVSSQYLVAFGPNYKYVYTLSPGSAGQYDLNQTWLLAPADR